MECIYGVLQFENIDPICGSSKNDVPAYFVKDEQVNCAGIEFTHQEAIGPLSQLLPILTTIFKNLSHFIIKPVN